jgi:hypothetical protein
MLTPRLALRLFETERGSDETPRREALRQQDLTDNAKANIGELGSAAEFTSSRPSLTKNLNPVAVQAICLEVCGMLRRGSPATRKQLSCYELRISGCWNSGKCIIASDSFNHGTHLLNY